MSDRPILFSAPMVQALLAGRKTQTRRVLNKQAALDGLAVFGPNFLLLPGNIDIVGMTVGDRLWVREHWKTSLAYDDLAPSAMGGDEVIEYFADGTIETWGHPPQKAFGRFRPGMFMPRWASRLTLTITDVRVERLQDISEADAWAEGCIQGEPWDSGQGFFPAEEPSPDGHGWVGWDDAREWYSDLWDQINGAGSWEKDPWVVATTFTVQHGNIDNLGGAL